MKKFKFYSLLILSLIFIGCASHIAVVPLTVSASTTFDSSISPKADVIKWCYKQIDGKLYKRLYNFTKGIWIGDWIPVS